MWLLYQRAQHPTTAKDNNAISGTDMRNTESKEQHYYFALSGSQKYEYRIPIRCYTATFDNVTAGTYAVWVQVDDTDTLGQGRG